MLAGLFAALLNLDKAGVTDSFFDLGGNSLSAMRLADLISQETGADISVTSVFLHPTPRRLAATLELPPSGGNPVMVLGGGEAERPLFLVHAIEGTVSAYTALGQDLGDAFRVYGLESPALSDPGLIASSLDDLVSDYTRRIRAVQPDGPYALGGWSMGGVIAFEIARRLEQAGARVDLLVLLDAPFAIPADLQPPSEEQARLSGTRWLDVFDVHHRMIAGYQPSAPPVRAPTLIVSATRSLNAMTRTQWPGRLSGPVSVLAVDSDHYAFLRPPLAAEVAAAIRTFHDNPPHDNPPHDNPPEA
jgi:thioesterase domain-containing protein/acyl carrier protein